jgi:hypothetical protein
MRMKNEKNKGQLIYFLRNSDVILRNFKFRWSEFLFVAEHCAEELLEHSRTF